MAELLDVERVVPALLAAPRRQRADGSNVPDHGFDLGLHEQVGATIIWHKERDMPTLVLNLVSRGRQQHLGVADAGGLDHVDDSNLVVAHGVEHRNLVGKRLPATFLVGRFAGQVKIIVSPCHRSLRRVSAQRQ